MKTDDPGKFMSKNRQVMIIGESGVGKTLLAATAARDPKRVFYIVADPNGIETLMTNGIEPDFRFIDGDDPYNSFHEILDDLFDEKDFPYDAVVIDDAVTLQLKIKNWIETAKKDEITTKQGVIDPRKTYGFLKKYMIDCALRAQDLPCHTVWLAWMKEGNQESGKSGGSMLEGQSADWLEGMCSAVVMLRHKKTAKKDGDGVEMVRELRTEAWGGFRLKNRMGLPDPFPIDVEAFNDGQPPEWTTGLVDLLNYVPGKKARASKSKKKAKKNGVRTTR